MAAGAVRLRLLGGFDLVYDGRRVGMPRSAQRLVAFLAMHDRPVERAFVAGNCWLDVTDQRAAANLRAVVWRLNKEGRAIVGGTATQLWLDPAVVVDLRGAVDRALRLIDPDSAVGDEDLDSGVLEGDLLPGLDSDWVVVERERLRQLRLHALDALCDRLTTLGHTARAVLAGTAAVGVEPLRESSRRSLIRAHLAAGNRSEALRQYRRYRALLADELGLAPSPLMEDLVADLG